MSFSLCGSVGANTGPIKCDRKRGIPKKVILGSAEFDSDDYASQSTFDAAFLAAFKLATGDAGKLYPFPEITGVTDKAEANKEATLGAFGPKVVLIEGKPAYEFDVIAGSTLEKQLRKFNGQQVPCFIVDDSNSIWGQLDSNDIFKGYEALIFTAPHKFGDGANGQTTKVSLSFVSAGEVYDSAAFIETDLSIADMAGLLDVTLAEYASTEGARVYHIKGYIKTSSPGTILNLADYFTTQLADDALWTAFTGASFDTVLPITSVAYNSGNKGWDITFASTEFDALADGAKIKLNLAAPDILADADVTGIEGVAVLLTEFTD